MNSKKYISGTLSQGQYNCSDQANLLVALCRAAKIPVRYVHGVDYKFSSQTV